MSHTPVTLLRAAPGQPWRRIDGFVTPDELLREYRQLLARQVTPRRAMARCACAAPDARVLAFAFCPAARGRHRASGEAIYRDGVLPSGAPLRAEREGGRAHRGRTAACVNCHRRSGFGMQEGRRTIPPVAGIYLFHPRAGTVDDLDLPFVEGMRADRDPYTEATLARAIREGVAADGKPLSYLMPHYALDDAEMAELIAYLK